MLSILEADLWESEASPREFQDKVQSYTEKPRLKKPKQTQAVCLQYA